MDVGGHVWCKTTATCGATKRLLVAGSPIAVGSAWAGEHAADRCEAGSKTPAGCNKPVAFLVVSAPQLKCHAEFKLDFEATQL